MAKKRLLTFEQLVDFCEKNKFHNFNSNDSGYSLSVQIPGSLSFSNSDMGDDVLVSEVRVCHTLLNRNKSYISEENMKKAMPTLKYKPFLAHIIKNEDGLYDFHSHDVEFYEDENGEEQIEYIEKQIGTFTAEDPHLEYDKDMDKTYVVANVVIPRMYTRAAEIIERRGGTAVSCELCINSMAYNAKEKYLELYDFYFSGVTALGEDVEPGMIGSKLTLEDFSTENNSFNFELNQIIQDAVTTALNNYKKNSEEGGNVVEKLNNEEEVVETETPEVEVEMEADETEATVVEETEVPEEETAEAFKEETEAPSNFSKKFELSHDDVRCGLYNLLATVENADNEWYGIVSVFDDNFIYQGMFAGAIYGQKYTKDGECVAFEGERYSLHAEYLTDSEFAQLNDMRNNYAAISEELATYKKAEDKAEKLEVFNDEAFAEFLDTKEFKELMSDESLEKFSKEELEKEANLAFSKLVKKNGSFSKKTTEEVENKKPLMFAFAGTENTNSFLDGLLNK